MHSMAYGRCGPRGFSRETALQDWLTAMSGPRRHRHGRHWGGPGGFGGPGGPRGPRAARGDVRAAALALLAEEPRNGYQLMQEIEERSGGVWRPSPGAIYPLSQLEDEGLVTATKQGSGRTFELTDEGRAHVEEHKSASGTAEPPHTISFRSPRPSRSSRPRTPCQIVGTPAVNVTPCSTMIPAMSAGAMRGPGNTWRAPANVAA